LSAICIFYKGSANESLQSMFTEIRSKWIRRR